MQADGNESWLARHEASSLGHDRQRVGLLFRFTFDDGDLGNGLFADLDLRHSGLPCFAALSIDLPKHDV